MPPKGRRNQPTRAAVLATQQAGRSSQQAHTVAQEFLARRVRRHLDDLERTNYSEHGAAASYSSAAAAAGAAGGAAGGQGSSGGPAASATGAGAGSGAGSGGAAQPSVYTELDDDREIGPGSSSRASSRTKLDPVQSGSDKRNRRSIMAARQLLIYRKTLSSLLEEASLPARPGPGTPANYVSSHARPTGLPPAKLCTVCGLKKGAYACLRCAERYCDRACRDTHDDARCERRVN